MAGPRDGEPQAGSREHAYSGGLGRAIRVIRAGRDMSRADLAEAADLSPSYIAEIENGKKTPSGKALAALANALGVAVHELIEASERWSHTPPPHSFEELREASLGRRERSADAPSMRLRAELPPTGARLRSASSRRSLLRRFLKPEPEEDHDIVTLADDVLLSEGAVGAATEPVPPSEADELVDLLSRLDPDDRERVLDLARRLAGD